MHSPIRVKVWNYRNVSFDAPLEIELTDGITFILGLNNIGKSNILRLFNELKPLFSKMAGFRRLSSEKVQENFAVPFDEFVNRRFQQKPVLLEVRCGDAIINAEIPAIGHAKSTAVTYSFRASGGDVPGPEAMNIFSDSLYIGALRGADFRVSGQSRDIMMGQEFVNHWSQWAGGDDVQSRSRIDDLEEEFRALFGYSRFHMRVNDAKNTLLVTTDDGMFKLDELGGGIAQLIIILGNAAIRNPPLVLIDEPEIGLHPQMQQVLVRALASKTKRCLLATSHSIGLARSTADRTFSLTKLADGNLRLAEYGSHYAPTITQSVDELGYSQFVEIGGNNILLVEGRTDIKSYREILRKFGIDTSYIVLSFGGREFIVADEAKIVDELSELKRLNAKIVAVIFDSDASSATEALSKRHQAFLDCCDRLGFKVFATDRTSTENYVNQQALDTVFGSSAGFRALGPHENFNQLGTGKWDKTKNWLLFRAMDRADFMGTGLGAFIEDVLVPQGSNSP